jgi:peptidoglycan hydrolase-like protein with peptidoglycan-binding domain
MNPAHRLMQLAFKSLGYPPGPIDGWWGAKTQRAGSALYATGPAKSSEWAVMTLQRGLRDLGYYEGAIDGRYGPLTRKALGAALDADGLHAASIVDTDAVLIPRPPTLRPVAQPTVLRQGSAGHIIDTYCLHCAAVPGTWAADKTNREMAEAIHRMHTLPRSRGGRGWSDTGYHAITCPDGETIHARPVDRIGAGAHGYNRGVFHHLMIEVRTITTTRYAEDYFRPETLAATKAHIETISAQTPITRLMGHREVAAKLCPGFEVIDRDWTDRAVA